MKQKAFRIDIKDVNAEGSFTGYAAVFNNVDLGGDIIAPGAFAKTILEKQDHPVLWGHMSREVIGVNKTYVEDQKGLRVEGQLVLEVQRAKEAHALMKAGAVRGMSIGYDTVRDELNHDTGVRTLKEVKLWEYSFTPFPMNPEAQLTAVKNMEDFEIQLADLLCFIEKQSGPCTADALALLERVEKQVSALRAAKAPGAAMQDMIAPELLHSIMGSRLH